MSLNITALDNHIPRDFSRLIIAVLYHPPSANNKLMLEYTEVKYPSCGLIIAGDFNKLPIQHICRQFQLKQIVNSPTRGSSKLDLILTNLAAFYDISEGSKGITHYLGDKNRFDVSSKGLCSKRRICVIPLLPSDVDIRYLHWPHIEVFYDIPSCVPPLGLSVHLTVFMSPKLRSKDSKATQVYHVRDKRPSTIQRL